MHKNAQYNNFYLYFYYYYYYSKFNNLYAKYCFRTEYCCSGKWHSLKCKHSEWYDQMGSYFALTQFAVDLMSYGFQLCECWNWIRKVDLWIRHKINN